jgi:hypothetical protein
VFNATFNNNSVGKTSKLKGIKSLNLHLPTKMAHSSKNGIFLPQDLSKNQIRQSPHTVSLPYAKKYRYCWFNDCDCA